MARTVAYVSRGTLFIKDANDPAREIARTSPSSPSSRRIRVSGLARGREPGELLYALDTNLVNGVFALDISRDPDSETGGEVEQRIFHSDGHRVHHLHARGDNGFVACDVLQGDGSASIAIMQADGSDITIVTDGNALDLAPRWIPGEDRTLVYQSAKDGTAINGKGTNRKSIDGKGIGKRGPFSIQKIDVRKQALETLAADTSFDFLAPQIAADGALYFIARPYARGAGARSFGAVVWNAIVLFGQLVVQWLLSLGTRFGATPNSASKKVEDTRITIWGAIVDLARRSHSGDDTPAIVPPTWRLCRRARGAGDAAIQTVAKGVVSFDLDDRGGLVFTNGRAIYAIDAAGTKTRLCTADAIEQVALLA